jgi:hypothetical protein
LLDGGNVIRVETTRRLGPQEGLTAVVAFPKGVVSPPSEAELRADWWRDNLGWIAGAGGLAVVFGYYLWGWNRVGRDPPEDVIVPRWTPPVDVSPALANYIEQRGFRGGGWDAFSASLIDLAVKGHVEIQQPGKTMTIRRTDSGIPKGLGVGQQAILNALPAEGDTLTVDKAGGSAVQKVGNAFRNAIEREHRNQFYRANPIYLVVGVIMSVIVLIATVTMGRFSPELFAAGIGVAIPAIVISVFAVNIGRSFRNARSLFSRIMSVVAAAFVGFIGLTVAGGLLALLAESHIDPHMLVVIAGLLILNLVFFFLMGAPTTLGQKLTAEIEGLKRYLTLAEKDRMNMRGAPEMSPRHFETLLPMPSRSGSKGPGRKPSTRGWRRQWRRGRSPMPDRPGTMAAISVPTGLAPALATWPARCPTASPRRCRRQKVRPPVFRLAAAVFRGGGGGGGGGGGW